MVMAPAVFPLTKVTSSYRERMFVKPPSRKFLMQNLPSGNIWRDSRIVGAVTLCCVRPIDRVSVPKGDTYLLERLGLSHLGDAHNRQLARQLREMP
jgi:hypothetical protein